MTKKSLTAFLRGSNHFKSFLGYHDTTVSNGYLIGREAVKKKNRKMAKLSNHFLIYLIIGSFILVHSEDEGVKLNILKPKPGIT